MSGGSMFQKTAADMIKGVRAHPRDEASDIAACITEIKEELKSTMQGTKQQAVLKLVYLEMMGYDVSWASFHFVDVMSFPRFRAKRIGFLAAQQCFHESTDPCRNPGRHGRPARPDRLCGRGRPEPGAASGMV
jgi:AP-3 complex subunit delta-1